MCFQRPTRRPLTWWCLLFFHHNKLPCGPGNPIVLTRNGSCNRLIDCFMRRSRMAPMSVSGSEHHRGAPVKGSTRRLQMPDTMVSGRPGLHICSHELVQLLIVLCEPYIQSWTAHTNKVAASLHKSEQRCIIGLAMAADVPQSMPMLFLMSCAAPRM